MQEHEETNKNDSVPLYMRTSNSKNRFVKKWICKHISQIHFLKYLINVEGTDANEEEDVPSWVHGVQEPDEDIESKTLLFEESVRRSLR